MDVNTTIKCPKCRQYLIRESEVKPYGKLFNLHCLECNHYFVENFKRHGYHYLIDSMRKGEKVKYIRERTGQIFNKPYPYCLVNYHKPAISVTEEFHNWYVKVRDNERKKLMA